MTTRNLLFPTTIVEDFYENPDEVRAFALSLKYYPSSGYWPGKKTDGLAVVDKNFDDFTCKKFLSIFYDFLNPLEFKMRTEFSLIQPHHPDKNHVLNQGWIHQDYNRVLAGVLYLNPNPDPDSGTIMYQTSTDVDEDWYSEVDDECTARFDAFKSYGKIYDHENYVKQFTRNRQKFKKTLSVDNVYNRLVAFDANQWHGSGTMVCGDKPRLTQLFFVEKIGGCPTLPPYERLRDIK